MPRYDFVCKKKKCGHVFEETCPFSEMRAGFLGIKCPECGGKARHVFDVSRCRVNIKGTKSKMNNFEYAAKTNMGKAQVESHNAREEAAQRGIRPYNDLPDVTDNGNRMNFID